MKYDAEDRAVRLAVYMIETSGTVRSAAKKFGVSKSTVHKDLQLHLPQRSPELYRQVRSLLEENKAQRHIRGGQATKEKYRSKQT